MRQLALAASFPMGLLAYEYALWWAINVFWRYVLKKYQSSLDVR